MTTQAHLYKTANATVVPAQARVPVWIVQAANPEVALVNALREFFLEMDMQGLYAGNFTGVRVDAVHPFAMLLFQEVMGQALTTNIFPSVTISDSVENEDFVTLGREFERVVLDAQAVAELAGYKGDGRLLMSDSALTRLQAEVAGNGRVVADKGSYKGSHRIDFNIWGDNKDVVSDIYDMVKLFVNTRREYLHELGIDVVGNLDGRRSGDINVEFGMLLFGANITLPCAIEAGAMRIELKSAGLIGSVDTQTQVYPSYHTE